MQSKGKGHFFLFLHLEGKKIKRAFAFFSGQVMQCWKINMLEINPVFSAFLCGPAFRISQYLLLQYFYFYSIALHDGAFFVGLFII